MPFDGVLRDRAERIQPHMQGDEGQLHPLIPQGEQQLRREMQSRCRRSSAAQRARIHRLIALRVVQGLMNVRRQGHLPDAVEIRLDGLREHHRALAAFPARLHLSVEREGLVTPQQLHVASHARARSTHERPPTVLAQVPQQQNFDFATAGRLPPKQPRRDDAALIGDEQIAGMKVVPQLPEAAMFQRTGVAVNDEQPRAVPGLHRLLRDELRRKVIVKIGSFHLTEVTPATRPGATAAHRRQSTPA